MTAIITKQNAKDGAFIDGTGIDKDSSFHSIHVYQDATIDHNTTIGHDLLVSGDTNLTGDIEVNGKIVNQELTDKIEEIKNKTEFDTLHVKGDATIDKTLTVEDIKLNGDDTNLSLRLMDMDTAITNNTTGIVSLKEAKIDHETRIQTLETDDKDHEARIKVLEETPAPSSGLDFEDGCEDFILSKDNIVRKEVGDYIELELKGTFGSSADSSSACGEGNLFEIEYPSNMKVGKGISQRLVTNFETL